MKSELEVIKQSIVVFDGCLVDRPEQECQTEQLLKTREATLRDEIRQLLSTVGISLSELGPESVNRLRSEISAQQHEIFSLKSEISRLQSERSSAQTEQNAARKEQDNIRQEQDAIQSEQTVIQKEQNAIRKKQEAIQNERNDVQKKLDGLSETTSAQSDEMHSLERMVSDLIVSIDHRRMIKKLWYLIFPDKDSMDLFLKQKRKDDIETKIEKIKNQIRDWQIRNGRLEEESSELSVKLCKLEDRRTSLDDKLAKLDNRQTAIGSKLSILDDILSIGPDKISWLSEKLAVVERKMQTLEKQAMVLDKAILKETERESCAVRIREIHDVQRRRNETCRQKWTAASEELSAALARIRERQPKIADLAPDAFGHASSFPDMFSVGAYVFSGGGQDWTLPRLLPFPFPRPLLFPPTPKGRDFVREVLLRAFQCIPPDALEITVCDPKHLGNSLAGFLALLENRKPFPDGRCLTTPKDIENALSRIHAYIAEFVQRDCVGGVWDWASFNSAHPEHPHPCKLLVMFDLPEQLTPPAAACLALILENGPRCGVFPLVSCDVGALDSRRDAVLLGALSNFSWDAFSIRNHIREFKEARNFKIAEDNSRYLPDANGIEFLLSDLKADYKRRDASVGEMEDLYCRDGLWSADSRDGIETAIGWIEEDRTLVRFSLGSRSKAVHHALLGGKTGSGKSNLVHVIIHGLCHRYSPEELNLYLLDYKDATEFNAYANPMLPHVRLVATESDVEFGISVLRHLEAEMTARNALFKKADVGSLYEYREKTGAKMPRILLVVDEFQKFFGRRDTADVSEALLENLLRLGRNAGVHLLLATQSLSGMKQIGSLEGLKRQLACRIALSCSVEDSGALLGQSNEAAAQLQSPPQGIINNENGAKSSNIFFAAPEAKRASRKQHLFDLHEAAAARGFDFSQCRVFSGNRLPAFPAPEEFNLCCSVPGMQSLLLGRTADFDAAPVVRDMAGKNLCIIGRLDFLPDLKRAVATSLSRDGGGKAVLLYSEHPENWGAFAASGADVQTVDEEWTGAGLDAFARRDEPQKFIVLDGIEDLKPFHPDGYKQSSLAATLCDLISRPKKTGVQLILCAKDYKRAVSVAKELMSRCDLRVGDASVSDLAAFSNFDVGGSRTLALPNDKVIIADKDAVEMTVFRPFCRDKEEEEAVRV